MDYSSTLHTVRILSEQLSQLESDLTGQSRTQQANQIVQLRTDRHATFGGALFRIRKAERGVLTGYLLVPHRAGMRIKLHSSDVTPVGTLAWPEPAWSYNVYGAGSRLLASLLGNGHHDIAGKMCAASIELKKIAAAK